MRLQGDNDVALYDGLPVVPLGASGCSEFLRSALLANQSYVEKKNDLKTKRNLMACFKNSETTGSYTSC